MTGRLSRSRYLAGIQCPKRLHLEIQEGIIAGLQYYRMNFEVRDEGGGARLIPAAGRADVHEFNCSAVMGPLGYYG